MYGNWMAIFRAMALLGMLWSSHLDGDFVNAQQEEADEQCTRDDAPGHLGPLHALQDGDRDQWGRMRSGSRGRTRTGINGEELVWICKCVPVQRSSHQSER